MSCILYNKGSYRALEANSTLANTLAATFHCESLADFLFELNADAFQVRYGHNESIITESREASLDVDFIDHEFDLEDWNDPALLRDLLKRIEYQCSDILTSEDPENPRYLSLVAMREDCERRMVHPIYVAEARAKEIAKQEIAKAEKAVSKEQFIKELQEKYPWAKAPNASKNIKKELTLAFPGIKFSVRSRYHGSINISWTDGPTTKEVDAITAKYEDGDFDGMTDCYNYDHSAYGEAVSVVLGRSRYVTTSREMTARFLRDAVIEVCFEYGHDELPLVKEWKHGGASVEGGNVPYCQNAMHYDTLQQKIMQFAYATSAV